MSKKELTPYSIVAQAEQYLFKTQGSPPSITDIANHIRTPERLVKMFLMRYKDEFTLKDIGLVFGIGPDRVTQLLYKFSHDLLMFYCRERNNDAKRFV